MTEIENHALLTFLEKELVSSLVEKAEVTTHQEEDVVFREQEKSDDIYMILQGAVRVTKVDPSGKEQLLAILYENDYFGEYSVIDGQPRSASIIVGMADTVLAKIPGKALLDAFDKSGEHAELRMLLHVIRKVRENNQTKVEEILRKERSSLLGDMASKVAHDLKNPTATISMAVSIIRKKGLTEYQEKLCEMIKAHITRMTGMVDEIMDFSKGAPSIKLEPTDIGEVFKLLDDLNSITLAQSKTKLVVPQISQILVMDGKKMFRVLQNLVGNAAEALSGVEAEITLGCQKKGDFFEITVSDNGPGIPEDMQACLFDAFTTKGKSSGTGLGMAITKGIVDAHKGTIGFETSAENGTHFTVQIPCSLSADEDVKETKDTEGTSDAEDTA